MAAHMHNSLLHNPRPLSWRFFALSVLGHALLFVLMLGFLERPKTVSALAQKPIRASLVRLGKPRDPSLLPRQEMPRPPPPTPASAPSSQPASTPTKTPAPPKTVDASAHLFSAISREAREAKNSEPLHGQADGDAMGDSSIQEGERYFGLLSIAVRRHYDVSSSIPENQRGQLEAVAFIRIAPNGKMLESKLLRSSGNLLFDAAVESALKRAAPFAPPPEHLQETLRKDGVQLTFSP